MQFEEDLIQQVINASKPVHASAKDQLMELFKDQYGDKKWKGKLASIIGGTTDKKSTAYKSAIRHFQGKRLDQEGKRSGERWVAAGKTMPPIGYEAPEHGYKVTFIGEIRISRQCYPRSFERYVTGIDAAHLAADPDIAIIFMVYFDGEDVAEGYCGDPVIIIEANTAPVNNAPSTKRHAYTR